MYVRNGRWLIDYGSHAQGWYDTRNEAIEVASGEALREHRELTIEQEATAPDSGPDLLEPSSAVLH